MRCLKNPSQKTRYFRFQIVRYLRITAPPSNKASKGKIDSVGSSGTVCVGVGGGVEAAIGIGAH